MAISNDLKKCHGAGSGRYGWFHDRLSGKQTPQPRAVARGGGARVHLAEPVLK